MMGILRTDRTKSYCRLGAFQFFLAILFATPGATIAASGQAAESKVAATPEARSLASLWSLADANFAQGNLTEAESILRNAAEQARSDQEKAGTSLRLGLVLTSSGNTVEARRQLDDAEALRGSLTPSEQSQLSLAQGGLAVRLGDFVTAEKHFERAAAEAKLDG